MRGLTTHMKTWKLNPVLFGKELSCALCCVDVTCYQRIMVNTNSAFMVDLMVLDEKPGMSMTSFLHTCRRLVSGEIVHPGRRQKQE